MDIIKKALVCFSIVFILVLVCGCVNTPEKVEITINQNKDTEKSVSQDTQISNLQNNQNKETNSQSEKSQKNDINQNYEQYSNNDFNKENEDTTINVEESEGNYNEPTYNCYIEITYPDGTIPDKIEEQTLCYIKVIDPAVGGLAGIDIYVDDNYIGTLDDVYGTVEYTFYEPGYHTITAEYNGEVLASETIYVYESYDQQQTQTQFSGIEIYVDGITPHNELIIKKIVMSPDLLLMLAGMPPELKITMENGEEINLKYVSMDVDLIIYNPNSKSVTIDKLILNMVDDEGHSLGKGEISGITITPGENPVTVKVDIPINKMGYEILRKLNGEDVIAEISGSAYIGNEEIPFSGKGELLPPLPAPPFPLPPLPPFPTE